jgi:hypothetical protein
VREKRRGIGGGAGQNWCSGGLGGSGGMEAASWAAHGQFGCTVSISSSVGCWIDTIFSFSSILLFLFFFQICVSFFHLFHHFLDFWNLAAAALGSNEHGLDDVGERLGRPEMGCFGV